MQTSIPAYPEILRAERIAERFSPLVHKSRNTPAFSTQIIPPSAFYCHSCMNHLQCCSAWCDISSVHCLYWQVELCIINIWSSLASNKFSMQKATKFVGKFSWMGNYAFPRSAIEKQQSKATQIIGFPKIILQNWRPQVSAISGYIACILL
jgi:hypothetical protein